MLQQRKTTRITNYDYSTSNYYFVTICTKNKSCIFYTSGKVNNFGSIANDLLFEIPERFSGVHLDKWIVMPNHVHAIIYLEPNCGYKLTDLVGLYKSSVSKKIHEEAPDLQVWQRSFHDHIIRNQKSYEKIWSYIDTNLLKWKEDCFYIVK